MALLDKLKRIGDWVAGATPADVKDAASRRQPGMTNGQVMEEARKLNKKKALVGQKVVSSLSRSSPMKAEGGGKSW